MGIISELIQWAEQRESIRAIPNGLVDRFSDYHVILVAEDIHPFYDDRCWLENLQIRCQTALDDRACASLAGMITRPDVIKSPV